MLLEGVNDKILDFNKFINMNKDEQIKLLKEYWGIKENSLQGVIASKGDRSFTINSITSLDGQKLIINPFTGNPLKVIAYNDFHNEDIKKLNLSSGDNIVFEFTLVNKIYKKNGFVNIKSRSIIKLGIAQELYSQVGLINEDISELVRLKKLNMTNEDLKSEKKSLLKSVESLNESFIERCNDLETLNYNIKVLKEEEDRLVKLGILNSIEKIDMKIEKLDVSRDKYIDYIIKYLACSYRDNLYYNKETIERLYTALSTSQLVILSGSPGTGKTSLIEGFSDVIGANKKIISVQPNWTETQDLIGFYNPIDKKYISTPFLDFLIEAKDNEDHLHIVCLDEMNLAHVEYYFAEFLSKLESKDRKIELYSEEIYIKNKEEIKNQMNFIEKKYSIESKEDIFNIDDISIFEKYNELKSQYQNLLKYNHKITIPNNIRFVGTINKDETTKNLSPKVVDRSFIMEVGKYSEETKLHMIENIDEYKENYNKVLNLESEDFKVKRLDINEEILNELNKISETVVKEFDISLNNRFYKQVEEINSVQMLSQEELLDTIILTKIIPKINVYIESENEEKIHKFEEVIKDKPNSIKAFNKMKLGWNDTEVLTFWR